MFRLSKITILCNAIENIASSRALLDYDSILLIMSVYLKSVNMFKLLKCTKYTLALRSRSLMDLNHWRFDNFHNLLFD